MNIGNRIRSIRKERGMKLQDLAKKSGVQIATLSRMEHNKMKGTVDSHIAIAKALGVELTTLYQDIIKNTPKAEVSPAKEPDVTLSQTDSALEILTSNVMKKKMMPALLKLGPGKSTQSEQFKLESERFVYLESGEMDLDINGETFSLKQASSVYFNASLPHHFKNTSKTIAKAIIITSPPQV